MIRKRRGAIKGSRSARRLVDNILVVGYFGLFDILPIVRKKRNATTPNEIKNRG